MGTLLPGGTEKRARQRILCLQPLVCLFKGRKTVPAVVAAVARAHSSRCMLLAEFVWGMSGATCCRCNKVSAKQSCCQSNNKKQNGTAASYLNQRNRPSRRSSSSSSSSSSRLLRYKGSQRAFRCYRTTSLNDPYCKSLRPAGKSWGMAAAAGHGTKQVQSQTNWHTGTI